MKNNQPRVIARKACIRCQQRHNKCNGEMPCEECKVLNLTCEYKEKTKRGPQPGAKKQLENLVLALQTDLMEEKKKADQWKQLYFDLLHGKEIEEKEEDSNQQIVTNLKTEEILAQKYQIENYLRIYMLTSFSVTGVSVPNFDLESLLRKDETPTHMMIYTMLASGALWSRDYSKSKEYIEVAKQFARSFFEENNLEVATAFVLIALYFLTNAQLEKSNRYFKLALSICESLNCTNEIYFGALMGQADLLPEGSRSDRYGWIVRKILEIPESERTDTLRYHLALSLGGKVKFDLHHPSFCDYKSNEIKYYLEILDKSERSIACAQDHIKARLIPHMQSIRALIFYYLGLKKQAHQMASNVYSALNEMDEVHYDIGVSIVGKCITFIHRSDPESYQKDLEMLAKIATRCPLAQTFYNSYMTTGSSHFLQMTCELEHEENVVFPAIDSPESDLGQLANFSPQYEFETDISYMLDLD